MNSSSRIIKIAVDARVLMNTPAGIANFLITAVNELSTRCPNFRLYILVNRDLNSEVFNRIIQRENLHIIKCPMPVFGNIGILWQSTKLYFILDNLKPDFFWGPANVLPMFIPDQIKTILTVHDLVSKRYKQTMMFVERIYAGLFLDRSIKKANILWTVSNFTKNELRKIYKKGKTNNLIVAQCFDHKLFQKKDISVQQKNKIHEKFSIPKKFILFVGTIEPRKNLKFLISLMPELHRFGFNLLIVGATGWGNAKIKKILNRPGFPKESVKFSGFIKTKELVELYNLASLLVLPSVYEGFGLPALEAMSCGCPVVAADNSGLHEVVENGGLLIKGWKKSDWVDGILNAYEDRDAYVKKGLDKASQYSVASAINQVINSINNEVLLSPKKNINEQHP